MGKMKLPEDGEKMWNDTTKIIRLVLVLAIVVVVFLGVSKVFNRAGIGELNPPAKAGDFKNMNYEDAKTRLEEAGFSKIELVALEDLKFGVLDKEGEVEEVSINGDSTFQKKSIFPKSAKVKISYHSFPEEPEEE